MSALAYENKKWREASQLKNCLQARSIDVNQSWMIRTITHNQYRIYNPNSLSVFYFSFSRDEDQQTMNDFGKCSFCKVSRIYIRFPIDLFISGEDLSVILRKILCYQNFAIDVTLERIVLVNGIFPYWYLFLFKTIENIFSSGISDIIYCFNFFFITLIGPVHFTAIHMQMWHPHANVTSTCRCHIHM